MKLHQGSDVKIYIFHISCIYIDKQAYRFNKLPNTEKNIGPTNQNKN